MEGMIRSFPRQLREALAVADRVRLSDSVPVDAALTAGMGGSGIGADLVVTLADDDLSVPFSAIKDYRLPAWAGPRTLVIASSYSGNTEETLEVLDQALAAGCAVTCVGSGGALADRALERGFDHIEIPGGQPPRTCLGYSLVQQFEILAHYGLVGRAYRQGIERAAAMLEERQEEIRRIAAQLATQLAGKLPVLYGASRWRPVLSRWCQQINENAKALCWMNVFPELNHNELEGWHRVRDDFAVVLFRSALDHPRTARRIAISGDILRKRCSTVIELDAVGADVWEQAFWWVHLGDWLSFEMATLRQVDPVRIDTIEFLKAELARD